MNKQFLIRFAILGFFYSLFVYGGIYFIKNQAKEKHYQKIYNKSQKIADQTLEILSNKNVYDKLAAIKFVFNNYQEKENSFTFYQISKKQNGIYQPVYMGKQSRDPLVLVHLNDLVNQNGQVRDGFIFKAPYIIYHQDMTTSKEFFGKLFIAYRMTEIETQLDGLYFQITIFSLVLFTFAILLFLRIKLKLQRRS